MLLDLCILSLDDLSAVRGLGIGDFHRVVSDIHHRLSDFIHAVVVHRRDEATGAWPNWIREDPMVRPYTWRRPDLVPPSPFLQCKPHFTPDGSGVLAGPARIDEEFRKAWLPYFSRSGQREASFDEFDREVDGWLPPLPEVHVPQLTCQMLADVRRKGATAGSLDGWGWRELKVLPVSWYDELARILTKVEDVGVWPDRMLDACIAMIPKTDGDATPLGQRPLSVYSQLCIVFGLLLVWISLRVGFGLGFQPRFLVLVVVAVRLRLGFLLLLILRRRSLLVPLTLTFISSWLMLSSLLIRLTGEFWIGFYVV